MGRKQNKGKEDGPQEWLEKGEKDLIEEIEAEKSEGKDNDERNKFSFHDMFPKENAGATKEKVVSDEPRVPTDETVINRLAAKLIATGNNSPKGASLPIPRLESWDLVRVHEEAGRRRFSSF